MTQYGSWLTNRRFFFRKSHLCTVLAETLVMFFLKNWLNEWHHCRVQNKSPAMNDITAGYKIRIRQFTSYHGCRILTTFSPFVHSYRIVQRYTYISILNLTLCLRIVSKKLVSKTNISQFFNKILMLWKHPLLKKRRHLFAPYIMWYVLNFVTMYIFDVLRYVWCIL